MFFPSGETVTRLRAKRVEDPYTSGDTTEDWSDPDELPIEGAFIAQSSTSRVGDATRTQALESKSLYCPPQSDVQLGDRIRSGTDEYEVDGIPSADSNPFTSWQPVCEVPLRRAVG